MSVKYAILGLLHYSDLHGYRIKSHLEEHFGYMWSVNFGQIYPCLRELEKEGLVRKTTVNRSGSPDRKLYSITEAGREAFARWLDDPSENRVTFRDPFLLKFVFSGFAKTERVLEAIDRQIRLYESQLEKRRANLARWRRYGLHVGLVAQLGFLFNEAFLAWLRQARTEVARDRNRKGPGRPLWPGLSDVSQPSGERQRSRRPATGKGRAASQAGLTERS